MKIFIQSTLIDFVKNCPQVQRRTSVETRGLIGRMVSEGSSKSLVARLVKVSWGTVDKWCKRTKHLKDRKRKSKESKITVDVEFSILALRKEQGWGSHRIQQSLIEARKDILDSMPFLVQKVSFSRETINQVLKAHGLNGYKRSPKKWKFFNAENPNDLWQLDPKGYVTIQGKKYWFVICIDDHSRYLVMLKYYDHAPSCEEMQKDLLPYIKKCKPKSILTDNNPFRKEWDKWCKEQNIESVHAHPYYPQDKGKVERAIRNVTEELINGFIKIPERFTKQAVKEYKQWYNYKRFHLGINNIPEKLFFHPPPQPK